MSPSLWSILIRRWHDARATNGPLDSAKEIAADIWDFVKEMMPERRRSLYGDAAYDWDRNVNTTSGGVSQRTRLLAAISGASYQPTEPTAFAEMMAALKINFSEFTFIDLGSGKGRTLLMAAEYPFRRIIGVELLPELHEIAKANIATIANAKSICLDAREFRFPTEPILLYLFNPLPAAALAKVMENLRTSLQENPRPVRILYHNPVSENVLSQAGFLEKIVSTYQYAIYSN